MSEKRAPRTVRLPDPEGGPELDLVASQKIWEAIEAKWGGLGALYLSHRSGHVQFRLCAELVWRCARQAGSAETLEQVSARCYGIGLHRLADVVDQIWLDIMKPTGDPADESEGESAAPLASGG